MKKQFFSILMLLSVTTSAFTIQDPKRELKALDDVKGTFLEGPQREHCIKEGYLKEKATEETPVVESELLSTVKGKAFDFANSVKDAVSQGASNVAESERYHQAIDFVDQHKTGLIAVGATIAAASVGLGVRSLYNYLTKSEEAETVDSKMLVAQLNSFFTKNILVDRRKEDGSLETFLKESDGTHQLLRISKAKDAQGNLVSLAGVKGYLFGSTPVVAHAVNDLTFEDVKNAEIKITADSHGQEHFYVNINKNDLKITFQMRKNEQDDVTVMQTAMNNFITLKTDTRLAKTGLFKSTVNYLIRQQLVKESKKEYKATNCPDNALCNAYKTTLDARKVIAEEIFAKLAEVKQNAINEDVLAQLASLGKDEDSLSSSEEQTPAPSNNKEVTGGVDLPEGVDATTTTTQKTNVFRRVFNAAGSEIYKQLNNNVTGADLKEQLTPSSTRKEEVIGDADLLPEGVDATTPQNPNFFRRLWNGLQSVQRDEEDVTGSDL